SSSSGKMGIPSGYEGPARDAGNLRDSMPGICVAVNAWTRTAGSSLNRTRKLKKSRPAAPMIRTFLRSATRPPNPRGLMAFPVRVNPNLTRVAVPAQNRPITPAGNGRCGSLDRSSGPRFRGPRLEFSLEDRRPLFGRELGLQDFFQRLELRPRGPRGCLRHRPT